jgi:hypothetical protein
MMLSSLTPLTDYHFNHAQVATCVYWKPYRVAEVRELLKCLHIAWAQIDHLHARVLNQRGRYSAARHNEEMWMNAAESKGLKAYAL